MSRSRTNRRFSLPTILQGIALITLLVGAAATAQSEPIKGGRITYGALRDATGFDPHKPGGVHNSWLLGNIYDTLLEYDLSGNLVSGLAESWSYDGPLSLTLTLREGVVFGDGTSFGTEDVLATFDRIRDPASVAARKATVDNVTSVDVVDERTVRLNLAAPDATLLHALASNTMYVVSADDVASGMNFDRTTNGTGPFSLDRWEPEREYILLARDDFWGEGPYLDEFVIRIIVDDRARIDALRSGQVDVAEYIPWQEFVTLQSQYAINTFFSLQSYLRVNHSVPPFDDVRVRQALGYIFDRDEINFLAFGGEGIPMTGPLQPAGGPYYQESLEGTYTKDWDRARELLREAGYATPADVPPLRMHVSVSQIATQPGLVVQQQLQAFGFNVEWISVDVPTLQENRRAGTYMLHIDGAGMTWPDPDYLRPIFHSEAGNVHAVGIGYANLRLDELLVRGNQLTDIDERRSVYLEAEQIILDDAVMHFFVWRPQADAVANYVMDYPAHSGGMGSFNSTKMEQVWRAR
jgi:peptide/nickel transport system substrate-binding protein